MIRIVPASPEQEGVWFHALKSGTHYWNFVQKKYFKGSLDTAVLQKALQMVIDRHDSLRTNFSLQDSVLFQVIHSSVTWSDVFTHIVNDPTGKDGKNWLIGSGIQQGKEIAFDFEKDILVRFIVLESEGEFIFTLVISHIITDVSSMGVFWDELARFYNLLCEGKEAAGLPPARQYFQFSEEQQAFVGTPSYIKQMSYWMEKLSSNLPPLNFCFSTAPETTSLHPAEAPIPLSLFQDAKLFALRKKVIFSSVFQLAWFILLHKITGNAEILVGNVVNGRGFKKKLYRDAIGLFAKKLIHRLSLSDESLVSGLLSQLNAGVLEDFENSNISYEDLLRAVNRKTGRGLKPLTQAVFNMIKPEGSNARFYQLEEQNDPGLDNGPIGDIQYEIGLTILDAADHPALRLDIKCGASYYPLAGSYIRSYLAILHDCVYNSSKTVAQIDLTNGDTRILFNEWNDTAKNYPRNKTLVDLFCEQRSETPEQIAVVFENQRMTYKTLDEQSNQLGHYLRRRGVKEETLVPICIGRSPEMLVGILGILKAGGAYVPIDPDSPRERIGYMLEDTSATFLISNDYSRRSIPDTFSGEILLLDGELALIAAEPPTPPQTALKAENLAYVIYTSGSTGKPKGVMIEHRSLLNYLFNSRDLYTDQETRSGSFQYLPYTFDAAVTSLFTPLICGKPVILCSKNATEVFEDNLFAAKAPYDFIKMTPAHLPLLESFLSKDNGPDRNDQLAYKLVLGGEALYPWQFRFLAERGQQWRIVNEYGPTETTVGCSTYCFSSSDNIDQIPIGKPMSNVCMYILTGNGSLAPIGVEGEICIGGIQVARGYLSRPGLTAEKFVQDPFSGEPGARMYRSGDLGCWMPDGNIIYLGRMDDQVKIRGYRVEPGEIESVVLRSGLARQVVVIADKDNGGNNRLVGYVVAEPAFGPDAITRYLQQQLPEYMIPTLWVLLESVPLTTNGKVDKRALPKADTSALRETDYTAPRSEMEAQLAKIWMEVLGIERVGIHNNFFTLGGHSLLATRVVSAVRKRLQAEISISDIFDYNTIALLADNIMRTEQVSALPLLGAQVRPLRIPLSYNQERLWIIDHLEGSTHYHIPWVLRVKGSLNTAALEPAFKEVVNRHEVLRTIFPDNGGMNYQQVMDAGNWRMERIAGRPYAQDPAGLSGRIASLVDAPFDLSQDYMLRVTLIEDVAEQEHMLIINVHHIASDLWSWGILVREMASLYRYYTTGQEPELPPLPIQYADYAIWQRNYLQGDLLEEKLDYWRHKLSDITPLSLPLDHARSPEGDALGRSIQINIEEGLTRGLKDLSQAEGVSLFMTLLSVFKVLLFRYSGQEDICVGTPIAGRTRQETEDIIGFFINTLALRTDLGGNPSFRDLLQSVRHTTLESYENQDVPFAKVVEAVVKERDLYRSPLFQVMFVMQNTPDAVELRLGDGISLSYETPALGRTKFDLTVTVFESGEEMSLYIEYCRDLFDAPTIERMMTHYKILLEAAVASPDTAISAMRMLTDEEKEQVLSTFNDTAADYPLDKTLIDLFVEQCSKTPDLIAVICDNRQISYRSLNERSNQLGHYLRSRGVKEDTLVPICIERSPEMIIGILGILKAGGAYVPIDPEYPAQRIGYMLEDTSAPLLLSSAYSRGAVPYTFSGEIISLDEDWALIAAEPSVPPDTDLKASNLAYMIYTSGSTGKPKGTMIEHHNVVNLLYGFLEMAPSARQDAATASRQAESGLMLCSYAFDVSVWEIFINLCFGATLHILKKESATDPEYIADYLVKKQITTAYIPPFYLPEIAALFKAAEQEISLQRMLVGVMPIRQEVLQRYRDIIPGIRIINGYGPTETTICATFFPFVKTSAPADNTPIGSPVKNYQVYILNDQKYLAPPGVMGEICIAGEGLGRGYWNNDQLTEAVFVNNPFATDERSKMYCTGDLGKWTSDGNVEFLGRKDDQAKINGYRIEPGEIEAILRKSDLVDTCVILIAPDHNGANRLIGYVIPSRQFEPDRLIQYLQGHLSEYMIPRLWVRIDSIPLTLNGKIDREQLLAKIPAGQSVSLYTAPRNKTEKELADILQDLLKVDKIGIRDNFFYLGGNSLMAIQLLSRIRKKYKLNIPVKIIFQFPYIDQVAEYIELFVADQISKDDMVAYGVFEL